MTLALTYALFALVAIIANIGTQAVIMYLYSGSFQLEFSVLGGTAIGLIIKYILDKQYIFHFKTKNLAHNNKTFLLYTFTGIFTTLIFWGFEFGFHYLFQNDLLRYVGGIIGLLIGYIIKYRLDKKHVFI
ncbi:GtrA family protein [Thiothrix winogradskyi]|uniref:GtrA family protein n=1 Tax=Thiothrix winogradskyi TaxID=96472 RepID=A0ABY3T0S5_9GAMM|nr:GtrA family protein [Thiothrix winogradskyi]UJS24345.1 GtrA family protein [Thiothrix winogradskyi]